MKRWVFMILLSIVLSGLFAFSLHTQFMKNVMRVVMKMVRVEKVADDPEEAKGIGAGSRVPDGEAVPGGSGYDGSTQQRQVDMLREAEEKRRAEMERNRLRFEDQQQRTRDQMERMQEKLRRGRD